VMCTHDSYTLVKCLVFGTLVKESHQKKSFPTVWPSVMISQAKVTIVEQ